MRIFALAVSWLVWCGLLLYTGTAVVLAMAAAQAADRPVPPAEDSLFITLAVSFVFCLLVAGGCLFLRHLLFVKRRRLSLDDGNGAMVWMLLSLCGGAFLLGVLAPGLALVLQGYSVRWAFLAAGVAGIVLLWALPLPPRGNSPPHSGAA